MADLTIEDVRQWSDIAHEHRNAALLLGNGGSRAVWDRFGYRSLYEEACLEGNGRTIEGILDAGHELKARGVKGRHEHTPGFYDEK